MTETRKNETTAYISGLADIAASAIGAASAAGTAVIADTLLKTAVIRKLEITDPAGHTELVMKDGDLGERQERSLLSTTCLIPSAGQAGNTDALTLYFAAPYPWSGPILTGLLVAAIAALGLLIWRASHMLAAGSPARQIVEFDLKQPRGRTRLNRFRRSLAASKHESAPSINAFGRPFESETDMIVLIAEKGHIVDASHGWLRKGGYLREKVLGLHMTEFIANPDRRMLEDRLERMHLSGISQVGTLKCLHANGSGMDVWFSAIPVSTPDGDQLTFAIIREMPELAGTAQDAVPIFSDHLTGLLNRMGFERALEQLLADGDQDVICILVDFNRFKSVIDKCGYEASEDVLRTFVKRLTPALDGITLAARFAGDEFAFAIAGKNARARAEELAEAIHAISSQPFVLSTGTIALTLSIGMAAAPLHTADSTSLLRSATIAVSMQKKSGRQGTCWFMPEMLARTKKRAETEADIVRGIEENLFEPNFQPIVSFTSGAVVGFETLMRLNHPEKGLIMPGDFIAIAEQTEQIVPAGRQFFAKALAGFRQIGRHTGNEALYLTVNLSPVQLSPAMVDFMAEKLAAFAVDPARLTVEITEAVFLEDNERIRESLRKLRRMGCRLALDDFGTGYSSLSYLSRLQVDVIKIDQSFTRDLTDPDSTVASRSRRLIEGIAAISLNMGCQMVAEGVEHEEQARQMHAIGAQYGQGYLFSRPLPLAQMLHWLAPG